MYCNIWIHWSTVQYWVSVLNRESLEIDLYQYRIMKQVVLQVSKIMIESKDDIVTIKLNESEKPDSIDI